MDVKLNRVDENKVNLEIQVEPQQVEEALDGAYRRLAQKVKIPGFRIGKVPRNVLEMRLGEGALMEEALETLVPDAYSQAVQEADIEPVSQPEVSDVQFGDDRSLTFSATVEVKPEVKLGEYKGLEIPPERVEVTEEMVEERLQQLQQQVATWYNLEEEAAQDGDMVMVDVVVEMDGELRSDLRAEGQSAVLGSGQLWPELEEGLKGSRVGDEVRVDVTWPEDGEPEELAGREVTLVTTVSEVKRQHLPEIDDEMAKDVSEFASLEELKADIRQRFEQAEREKVNETRRNQVMEKASSNARVELPPSMVARRQEHMQRQLEERLQQYGLDLDSYLQYTGRDREAYQNELRESAEESLKQELVLEAIARVEGLIPGEEDVEEELHRTAQVLASEQGKSEEEMLEEMRSHGYVHIIEETLMRRHATEFLLENATETEEAWPQAGGDDQEPEVSETDEREQGEAGV